MIDERVLTLAGSFTETWSTLLKDFPRYRLDLSWPSIGLVDLILNNLRGKRSLTADERRIVEGASAYLAGVALDCWSAFPGAPEVEIALHEHPEGVEVELIAHAGPRLQANESFRIALTSALEQVLRDAGGVVPIFGDGGRVILPDERLVSAFGAGVLSGLCPLGEGPWKGLSMEDFAEPLEAAARWMSASSAEYYRQCFPLEAHGSFESLYFPHLVLPPAGFQEDFTGARSVAGLVSYLRANLPEGTEREALCLNLAASPDDVISRAGLLTAIALAEENPSNELVLLAQSRRRSLPTLIGSIRLARSLLGVDDSWVMMLEEKRVTQAELLLSAERRLGLLPLFYLDDLSHLSDPGLLPLWPLLRESLLQDSRDYLAYFASLTHRSAEVSLQLAFLTLASGDYEDTARILRVLETEGIELSADARVKQSELEGLLCERRGERELCAELFRQAFTIPEARSSRLPDMAVWLAQFYKEKGELGLSSQWYERALQLEPVKLEGLIGKLELDLITGGEREDLRKRLKSLVHQCPTNPRVFELAPYSTLPRYS